MDDYENNDNWFDLTNHSLDEVTTHLTKMFNRSYLIKFKEALSEHGIEVACVNITKSKREFLLENLDMSEEDRTYIMLLDL